MFLSLKNSNFKSKKFGQKFWKLEILKKIFKNDFWRCEILKQEFWNFVTRIFIFMFPNTRILISEFCKPDVWKSQFRRIVEFWNLNFVTRIFIFMFQKTRILKSEFCKPDVWKSQFRNYNFHFNFKKARISKIKNLI